MKLAANIRAPAAAGRFYPGDPGELRSLIESLLANAAAREEPRTKALIAPHAGYVYSGPIAASAYACWRSERHIIKRVVLLGPTHFVPVAGLAVSSADCFSTPLGQVSVDQAAIRVISRLPQVRTLDRPHEPEHSLEVHLPFLQVVLEQFEIVPILVGDAEPLQVTEVIELLWGGAETRILVSSDLSHYHDWATARELDQFTAAAVERLQPEAIRSGQACGRIPILGLLGAAQQHRLKVETLDLRNSGDTAGDRSRVVGYGAFAFRA